MLKDYNFHEKTVDGGIVNYGEEHLWFLNKEVITGQF
jgi:hypothetical protein